MGENVRQLLLDLQSDLEKRVEGVTRDLNQAHSQDSEEQATERENDDVLRGLAAEAREELEMIRIALQKLDGGTYGECVSCGEPIAEARLAALPFATRCIRCAS